MEVKRNIYEKDSLDEYIIIYKDSSYIQFFVDYKSKCCNITNLFVDVKIRKKGIGTMLINECFKICDKIVNYYELDDMTDRWNKKNNIYLKTGFKYIDMDNGYANGPEMIKIVIKN
jgi:GNAT superfamily N-acetyltransferase